MPRPKGSKNKKPVNTVEEIDAQIAALNGEIDALTEQLKSKKAEMKVLQKNKLAAEKAAAKQKAAESQAAILAAVAASGKSVEEILELLNGQQDRP